MLDSSLEAHLHLRIDIGCPCGKAFLGSFGRRTDLLLNAPLSILGWVYKMRLTNKIVTLNNRSARCVSNETAIDDVESCGSLT